MLEMGIEGTLYEMSSYHRSFLKMGVETDSVLLSQFMRAIAWLENLRSSVLNTYTGNKTDLSWVSLLCQEVLFISTTE